MQKAGAGPGGRDHRADNASITSALQASPRSTTSGSAATMGRSRTGAAGRDTGRRSRPHELRQSIDNGFNGVMNGVMGCATWALRVDPRRMWPPSIPRSSMRSSHITATVRSRQSTSLARIFSKSAELLVSANNFIPNRLANLDRVIDYISDNKVAAGRVRPWRCAAPVGDRRAALAAYKPDVQGLSVIGCASAPTAP